MRARSIGVECAPDDVGDFLREDFVAAAVYVTTIVLVNRLRMVRKDVRQIGEGNALAGQTFAFANEQGITVLDGFLTGVAWLHGLPYFAIAHRFRAGNVLIGLQKVKISNPARPA